MKIVLLTFFQFISPLIIMIVLSSLPENAAKVMTSEEIVRYFLFTSLLYVFMSSKIDSFVKEAILRGDLATFLIKPVNFWLVALMKDLSHRFVKLVVGLPVTFILCAIYFKNINFNSAENIFFILTTLLIGYTLSFLISFANGLLAFFIEEIWGFQNLKEVLILLLGGAALPYKYFPETVSNALTYTPFPYIVNWPIRMGFSGNITKEILIASIWLLTLLFISTLMWRKGLRKYSGMGTF